METVDVEKQLVVVKPGVSIVERLRPYVATVAFMCGVAAALLGVVGALVHCARIGDAWGCVAAGVAGLGVALNALLHA